MDVAWPKSIVYGSFEAKHQIAADHVVVGGDHTAGKFPTLSAQGIHFHVQCFLVELAAKKAFGGYFKGEIFPLCCVCHRVSPWMGDSQDVHADGL